MASPQDIITTYIAIKPQMAEQGRAMNNQNCIMDCYTSLRLEAAKYWGKVMGGMYEYSADDKAKWAVIQLYAIQCIYAEVFDVVKRKTGQELAEFRLAKSIDTPGPATVQIVSYFRIKGRSRCNDCIETPIITIDIRPLYTAEVADETIDLDHLIDYYFNKRIYCDGRTMTWQELHRHIVDTLTTVVW